MSGFPTILPFLILGILYSYKVFLSQLVKALCLSKIVTEAPFPSIESQGLPSLPPVLFLLVMLRTPGNLIRPGSALLGSLVRHVFLLLLASSVKFFVRLYVEVPAFISPLAAHA